MMYPAVLLLAIGADIVWGDSSVPVLLWGSKSDPLEYRVPALRTLPTSEFLDNVLRKSLHNVPVVGIFVEPSLGSHDLRWVGDDNKSAYPYIESEMSSKKFSKFFPRVNDPMKAVKALAEHDFRVSEFDSPQNLPDNSKKNVLIIKLDDSGYDENKYESFRKHDDQINKICSLMKERYGEAVCLLTARKRSSAEPIHGSSLRKLLAVTADNTKPLNVWFKDSILVYSKYTPELLNKRTNATLKLDKQDSDVVTMNNKTQDSSVTLQVKKPNLNNLLINYIFRIDGDKWKLEGVKVTDENNQESTLTTTSFIGSSYGFSYHTPLTVTFNSSDWQLSFKTLQAEVYKDKRQAPKFSVADDAVGFFTIPIWSGIFVSSLFIAIVLGGLSMIFDIKTMDQFDDPKGKTVTINATE